jgi:hypothetical protein
MNQIRLLALMQVNREAKPWVPTFFFESADDVVDFGFGPTAANLTYRNVGRLISWKWPWKDLKPGALTQDN